MFKESLLSLPEGRWLAITLDDTQEHQPPTREIGLAYAVLHLPDGSERDMLSFLSLPIPADEKAAMKQDQSAAGQRELAEQAKGSKSEAAYRDSARRDAAEADALRKPTRLLPRWLFPLSGTRLLCGFHLHREPVRLREVDIATLDEIWSADAAQVLAQIGDCSPVKTPADDPQKEIQRLTAGLDFDRLSEAEAQVLLQKLETLSAMQQEQALLARKPLMLRPWAADDGRLLFDAGQERLLVSFKGGKFRFLARWPGLRGWSVAARTDQGFVFHCVTEHDGRDEVRHVRAAEGADLAVWPSKGRRVLSSAAGSSPPGSAVVLAALGGELVVQNTRDGSALKLPRLLGVDKYDSLEVGLSPSGRLVGMCRSYDATEIALLDVDRGLAASVPSPDAAAPTDPTRPRARAPAFALTDDALLVLAQGKLSKVALSGLEWQTPIKPPPPIKRRRTPALTLEGALQQGPLSDIADQVRSWFRPGVLLVPKRLRGDRAPVGSSKSGGCPDLPVGGAWPRYRNQPMAFMLQINLSDVAAIEPGIGLPKAGLLNVFLALDEYPVPSFYSDANASPEGCRIIYTPDGVPLERATPPADMPTETHESKGTVCAYTVRAGGAMLPELSNDRVERAKLTTQQSQAYRALVLAVNGDDDSPSNWTTRLGGYPAQLQNDDIHLHSETYARGLSLCASTYAQWSDPDFQLSAQGWRQLLQLAEGKEGWIWGDAGLMHVMVRDEQWSSADFHPAWGIGVCH